MEGGRFERERASKGREYGVEKEGVYCGTEEMPRRWKAREDRREASASGEKGKRGGRRGISGERLEGREERHRLRKARGEGGEASAEKG